MESPVVRSAIVIAAMFVAGLSAGAQEAAPKLDQAKVLAAVDVPQGKLAAGGVTLQPWWKDGESPGDIVLAIHYKDSADAPTIVTSHTGSRGFEYVGQFGGAKDGQDKVGLVYVARSMVGKGADGYVVRFTTELTKPVEKVQVLAADEALKRQTIAQGRAARARHVENMKKVFTPDPWQEKVQLGEVAAEHKAQGFIPFARSWNLDVFPGSIPKPEERGAKTLQAYATLGEFEPLQAAVHALTDAAFTAQVSDLAGPGTLRFGRDVWVNAIECAAVRSGGGSSIKQWQVKPVWLRDNEPVEVKAGTSQAWYVTVRVPKDAKPGDYKGTLTVEARGGGKAAFPIELKVLPFALDKADHVARGAYISGPRSDEMVRDMADHGLNAASMWQSGLSPKLVDGKCVNAVPPATEHYLVELKKAGFVQMVCFGGGDPRYENPGNVVSATGAKVGSKEFETYYGQFWQDIRRQEKEKNWPEMVCCPFDEPVKTEAKTKNYLICHDIVKKVSPETKVFCVFMNRNWAAKKLGKQADIWSCNGAFAEAQAEKKALAAEGVNKLFYTYTGCMAASRPGTVRFNAGFYPWKFDADGVYFWAHTWSADDPFNDLDGDFTDWSPVGVDVDGKLYGCVGWEGWREGVDDRRYVETALRLAREKKRPDVLDKLEKLKQEVSLGQESETSTRTAGLDDFFFKLDNTSALDVYRARVVALIMEMMK